MNLIFSETELKQSIMESKQSSIFATLIFALVFIVGGWLFYKHVSQTIIDEANASKNWPTVQGVVSYSDIITSISDGDEMYRVDIEYNYTVQTTNYKGDRIATITSSTNSLSSVEKDLRKYPVGEHVSVYYNPEAPSISMLEPGAGLFTYVITYGPLLFCLVGFLMLLQVVKKIGLVILALFVGLKN